MSNGHFIDILGYELVNASRIVVWQLQSGSQLLNNCRGKRRYYGHQSAFNPLRCLSVKLREPPTKICQTAITQMTLECPPYVGRLAAHDTPKSIRHDALPRSHQRLLTPYRPFLVPARMSTLFTLRVIQLIVRLRCRHGSRHHIQRHHINVAALDGIHVLLLPDVVCRKPSPLAADRVGVIARLHVAAHDAVDEVLRVVLPLLTLIEKANVDCLLPPPAPGK